MSTAWQVAFVAWSLLVATCAWAITVLLRRIRAVEILGVAGPRTALDTPDTVRIRLQLTSTQPTLVTFLTDSCGACERVVPTLNELQEILERREVPLSAHALLAGEREGFIHRNRLSMAALQGDMDTYRELGISATPESVLYAPGGSVIARGHPLNREQLADFLESALGYRPLAPSAINRRTAPTMSTASRDLNTKRPSLEGLSLHERTASIMSERCGIAGCWDQNEVEVCWRRYVTNKATALRYGPSANAGIVPQQMSCVGTGQLAAGETVCLQSTRNPTCLDSPPLRPAENGFVWAYENDCKISGWIPAADVGPQAGPPCCGPAGQDFPCGLPDEPRCMQSDPCHPDVGGSASGRSGCARVNVRELTLRYAPQSTAFRYLLDDDIVRRRCGHSSGYHCVDVLESNTAQGARGWVTAGGTVLVDVPCPT